MCRAASLSDAILLMVAAGVRHDNARQLFIKQVECIGNKLICRDLFVFHRDFIRHGMHFAYSQASQKAYFYPITGGL